MNPPEEREALHRRLNVALSQEGLLRVGEEVGQRLGRDNCQPDVGRLPSRRGIVILLCDTTKGTSLGR